MLGKKGSKDTNPHQFESFPKYSIPKYKKMNVKHQKILEGLFLEEEVLLTSLSWMKAKWCG